MRTLKPFSRGCSNFASVSRSKPHRVDFERSGTEGRCDLLISSKQVGAIAWLCHAVLELKVLRSFSSSGRSVSSTVRKKAVEDGLLQAIAYKRQHDAAKCDVMLL